MADIKNKMQRWEALADLACLYPQDQQSEIDEDLCRTVVKAVRKWLPGQPDTRVALVKSLEDHWPTAVVTAAAYGERDRMLVLVIDDDCGHTHVVTDYKSAKGFLRKCGIVACRSDRACKVEAIVDKYRDEYGEASPEVLAERLLELGEEA